MIWLNFLHFYQPPTQKKFIIDDITGESYRPLVQSWLKNPNMKITLNINSILLEHLEAQGHLDIIEGIKKLAHKDQIEITGSGKFHPILPLLPENEIKRQIYLNEVSLYKYLDLAGPSISKEKNIKQDIVGFFPPEMAYTPSLAKIVKDIGYEWVMAEELSYEYSFNQLDFTKKYIEKDSDIQIVFRDRHSSYQILSGRITSGNMLFEKFGDNKVLVTGMDGETFGHHRVGLEKVLEEYYEHSEIEGLTVKDWLSINNDVEYVESKPASWALLESDIIKDKTFPLWDDSDNEIHAMQWKLMNFAINKVREKDEVDSAAGIALDRALHSDQFWWASAKPWWGLEYIETGAKELLEAVKLIKNVSKEDVKTAKDLYVNIVMTAFEWQKTGKVGEMSKQYDEQVRMLNTDKWATETPEAIKHAISEVTKEVKTLADNWEFERAAALRDRIKELDGYLKSATKDVI